MTRNLPWLGKDASTTKAAPRKGRIATPHAKRARPLDSSDVEGEEDQAPKQTRLRFGVSEPATSSPPDVPQESFMEDGLDRDDKYRMVEDEFLETAKLFTQHLHAAEYRRMKEAARKQNADTITTIVRPVTQRMPNATKRKVESVSRAKKQGNVVKSLLGKEMRHEDESDDEGSAWIGTALHGLMDSPRKSAANLLALGTMNSNTRAAAGLRKPKSSEVPAIRHVSPTPTRPKHIVARKQLTSIEEAESGIEDLETEDDDDDLDGHPPQPNLPPLTSKSLRSRSKYTDSSSSPYSSSFDSDLPPSHQQPHAAASTHPTSSTATARQTSTSEALSRAALDSAARIARRREHARLQQAKTNKADKKKLLDIIPTFLG